MGVTASPLPDFGIQADISGVHADAIRKAAVLYNMSEADVIVYLVNNLHDELVRFGKNGPGLRHIFSGHAKTVLERCAAVSGITTGQMVQELLGDALFFLEARQKGARVLVEYRDGDIREMLTGAGKWGTQK